jgi:hypothetical protein
MDIVVATTAFQFAWAHHCVVSYVSAAVIAVGISFCPAQQKVVTFVKNVFVFHCIMSCRRFTCDDDETELLECVSYNK